MRQLWNITFSHPEAEECSVLLFEIGMRGAEIHSPTEISAFIEVTTEELEQFVRQATKLGFSVLRQTVAQTTNWVQKCEDLWRPVHVGSWTIYPTASEEEGEKITLGHREVALLLGMGFGTGHHATTNMSLELMDELALGARSAPHKILDVGTGSGILAIVAAQLWPEASVEAFDIDEDAVENAQCNVRINRTQHRIKPRQATMAAFAGPCDLLIANIYAEVLCELEPGFRERIVSGGLLIASGITDERAPLFRSHFEHNGWQIERSLSRDGWNAFRLRYP